MTAPLARIGSAAVVDYAPIVFPGGSAERAHQVFSIALTERQSTLDAGHPARADFAKRTGVRRAHGLPALRLVAPSRASSVVSSHPRGHD
jgi:hypothetical protein